jgi:MFS superfamily sulfate permease-like transporter
MERAAPGGDAAALITACATLTALAGAILTAASVLRLRPIPALNPVSTGSEMKLATHPENPRVVAFDLGGVFDLEYTAMKALTEAEKRSRANGVLLWLVGLTPGVLNVVQHSPLGEALGRERMFLQPPASGRPTSVAPVRCFGLGAELDDVLAAIARHRDAREPGVAARTFGPAVISAARLLRAAACGAADPRG